MAQPAPGLRHLLGSRLRQLPFAALEGRGRSGLERGEVVLEAGRDELVEPLGLVQVFEPVLAEVSEEDVRNGIVAEQLSRGLRNEHLAAVPGRADAGRPMHTEADVPLAATAGSPVCMPMRTRSWAPSGQAWSASLR